MKKIFMFALMLSFVVSFAMAEKMRGSLYTSENGDPVGIYIDSTDNTVNTYIAWKSSGTWYIDPSKPLAWLDEDTFLPQADVYSLKRSGSNFTYKSSSDYEEWFIDDGFLFYDKYPVIVYNGSPHKVGGYRKSFSQPSKKSGGMPSWVKPNSFFEY